MIFRAEYTKDPKVVPELFPMRWTAGGAIDDMRLSETVAGSIKVTDYSQPRYVRFQIDTLQEMWDAQLVSLNISSLTLSTAKQEFEQFRMNVTGAQLIGDRVNYTAIQNSDSYAIRKYATDTILNISFSSLATAASNAIWVEWVRMDGLLAEYTVRVVRTVTSNLGRAAWSHFFPQVPNPFLMNPPPEVGFEWVDREVTQLGSQNTSGEAPG